ncbi:MAG: MAPEG family protein [SAR324 cluster bacterium]|nr:MAPEG family protein [SAR324 cluster bacterium]
MTIALCCLFLAGSLNVFSNGPQSYAQIKSPDGYDHKNSREQQSTLVGWGKQALSAHLNQIESFLIFAAGVLVVTATGIVFSVTDYLIVAYLIARIAYI